MTQGLSERAEAGFAMMRQLDPAGGDRIAEGLAALHPDLAKLAAEFPFGSVYPRPGLDLKLRQTAVLACLATRGDAGEQLRIHLRIAQSLGFTRLELEELALQLAPYSGFPTAVGFLSALQDVYGPRT